VKANVGKFVHQTKPEIVEAIIPQSHPNDRMIWRQEQRGTVKIGSCEVPLDDQRDAVLGQNSRAKVGP